MNLRKWVEPEKVFKIFLPFFFLALILDQGVKFASVFLDFSAKKGQALAFGFLPPSFSILALIFVFLFFIFFSRRSSLDYFSFGLFLGGGIANLIDLARLGYILDIFPFFTLFWFNLADFFIFLAVCIFASKVFLKKGV